MVVDTPLWRHSDAKMPKITRSNPKAFETLELKLKELEKIQAKTGWFETSRYEDGTPVAFAAALNELGHGNTPARPFMRPAAMDHKGEWAETAAKGARAVLNGDMPPKSVMELVAAQSQSDVLDAIVEVHSPPLSPVTIEIRAMKKRNPDLKVTGTTVGEAARKVHAPGYQQPSGVSVKPLNDSGLMIATLTHVVEEK